MHAQSTVRPAGFAVAREGGGWQGLCGLGRRCAKRVALSVATRKKAFFSEEKNQKTFNSCARGNLSGHGPAAVQAERSKSFSDNSSPASPADRCRSVRIAGKAMETAERSMKLMQAASTRRATATFRSRCCSSGVGCAERRQKRRAKCAALVAATKRSRKGRSQRSAMRSKAERRHAIHRRPTPGHVIRGTIILQ